MTKLRCGQDQNQDKGICSLYMSSEPQNTLERRNRDSYKKKNLRTIH